MDELYGVTVIAFYAWWARVADWLDRRVWGGIVALVAWLFGLWAQLNRLLDVNWVDGGFDKTCEELSTGGGLLARVEERPRAELPAHSCRGRRRAGRNSSLEQPAMNGLRPDFRS